MSDQTHVEFVWIDQGSGTLPGLEFSRASNALDLRFELLASNDLTAPPELWLVVSNLAHDVTALDATTELARFADSQPATDVQRFLRIRATYLP